MSALMPYQNTQTISMKYVIGIVLFGIFVSAVLYAVYSSKSHTQFKNTLSPSSPIVIPTLSLHDKILSLFILHVPNTDPHSIVQFTTHYHPAGIILMPDNIPANLDQLKEIIDAIQRSSTTPLLISIDQEGCVVKRIEQDNFNCAQNLKNASPTETLQAFKERSLLLKMYGINLNFGIIADITNDKNSFIYSRVFGSDPQIVSLHVQNAVQGSRKLTYTTLKHFPGHGETSENSHNTIPIITIDQSRWNSYDKLPFKSGIEAGAEFTMMGHLIYSSIDNVPASLSKKWHNILTNEMGFQNVIITDDMIMLQKSGEKQYADPRRNAVAALQAGNDIVLFVNEYNLTEEPIRHIDIDEIVATVESAVRSGQLSERLIDEHVTKVMSMRRKLQSN